MANERVIRINAELDTSGMLSGITQMRQMLGSLNVDSNLFKDVNKDLDKLSNLTISINSALKNGVPEKELKGLLKNLSDVTKISNFLPDKIRQISIETKNIQFPKETLNRLDEIEIEIEKLGKAAKDALGEDLRKNLRNVIPTDIISNKTLDKILNAKNVTGALEDELLKVRNAAQTADTSIEKMVSRLAGSNSEQVQAAGKLLEESYNKGSLNKDRDSLLSIAGGVLNKSDFNDLVTAIDNYNTARTKTITLENNYAQIMGIISNSQLSAEQKAQQIVELRAESQSIVNSMLQEQVAIQRETANVAEQTGENIVKGANEVATETEKANNHLQHQDSLLKQIASRATSLIGIGAVFNYITRGIREAWDGIKELDKEFTQIAVVTDKTTTQLWQSFGTYSQMAQGLGVTTKDAVATSALYYQQGLDTAEVMTLTAETIKMAQIAGMDFATATNQMTAALRGFNLEMSEASKVNDIFSTLAAGAAVDTQELAYALTKTASIAESAGMSIDTTSAFLTKMIETTREAPENIGTAMKSIVARFEELKSNPLALTVEVEGEEVVANKVEKAIALAGVRLRDETTGQFRDLDDVFLELAKSWDGLDRNTQRYIATIAAGSRQQSRFIALMDGYDRTLELVEMAQDSEGQSAAQFLKTLDSLDSKLNQISNSLESLYQKFVNSEFFGGLLDGLNELLQGLGKLDAEQLAAFAGTGVLIGNALINGLKTTLPKLGDAINTKFQAIGREANNKLLPIITGSNKPGKLRSRIYLKDSVKNAKNNYNEKKKNANDQIIEITVKKDKAEAEIRELKAELKELQDNNVITISAEGQITANNSNDKTVKNFIDEYEQKVPQLTQEVNTLNSDLAQAQKDFSEIEIELPEISEEEKTKFSKSLGNAAQIAGPALVATLGTSIATAIASDNPFDVFTTGMLTFLATAAPTFVSTFIQLGIESGGAFSTAAVEAGGPILLAITVALGAILGIISLVKLGLENARPEAEKIAKEIEKVKEKQDELDNTAERSQAEASVQKVAYKNLNNLLDGYEELYNKSNRTTEENEKLDKIIEDIANDFPDLVEGYDEAGNAIIKQRDTWDEIIEKQKESLILAQQQAYQDKTKAQLNELEVLELEKRKQQAEANQFISSSILGNKTGGFKSVEEVFDYLGESKPERGRSYLINPSTYTNFEYADQLKYLNISNESTSEMLKGLYDSSNSDEMRSILTDFLEDGLENSLIEDKGEFKNNIPLMVSQMLPDLVTNFLEPLTALGEQLSGNIKLEKETSEAKKKLDDNIENYISTYINAFGNDNTKKINKDFIKELVNNASQTKNITLPTSLTLRDEKLTVEERNAQLAVLKDRLISDNSNLTSDEKEKVNKIGNVNEITDEIAKELDNIVLKFQNDLIDTTSQDLLQNLENLGEHLTPEQLGLLTSFDKIGEYGRNTIIQLLQDSLDSGIVTEDFSDYIDKLIATSDQITQELEKKYTDGLQTIALKLGEETVKLFNEKVGQQGADLFANIIDTFEPEKLIKVSNAIASVNDWGNMDQLKALAQVFYDAGNNADEAAENVMKFSGALGGAVSLKIDSDTFGGYFTELGQKVQDTAKEYKDLYSAIEEYNELGSLSAQTITDLVAAGKAEYLVLDENTNALKLDTQAIEENWQAEMKAATATLDMEIARQEAAQAGLKIQLEVEKRKLEILRNAKNKNGAITAAEYNELRRLDEAYSVDIINNQINLNTESLIQDGTFFTDLLESREKGYGQLVQQAIHYGKQIQEALVSGITTGGTFVPTIDLSNAWAEQEKENRKASAKARAMPDSSAPYYHYDSTELDNLIAQEDELVKALEGEINNRDEVLKQLTNTRDKIKDITTNSTFVDYMKDTGKATKDANRELKDYISTLEKYYNLDKKVETLSKETQKAKKKWEKTGSTIDEQNYRNALQNEANARATQKAIYTKERNNDVSDLRKSLASYNISAEDIRLDENGFLDQDHLWSILDTMSKNGSLNAETGEEVEKIIKEKLSEIENDTKVIQDTDDWFIEQLEEQEEQKQKLEEIKQSIDRLANVKQALQSISEQLEQATEENQQYYASGGREGINGIQYIRAEAQNIEAQGTATKEYQRGQTLDFKELQELGYEKFFHFNEGDQKFYQNDIAVSEIDGEEEKKLYEQIKKLADGYNELTDSINDSTKAQQESAKRIREFQKTLRKTYSDMVNRLAEDMAKLDQKEIDEVKKKYAMIQEEDDKYLEALQKSIDKQRQLRDQARSYDDLEKDEKRLALLERDTSGANAAEIAALKEQIKDARQNLVDTEQDNIVNNIAEDNKTRKDKMDEETQFLQNVMDERTYDMQYYIDKAQDIVNAAIDGDAGAYQRMLDIMQEAEESFFRTTTEDQQGWLEEFQSAFKQSEDWRNGVLTGLSELATSTRDEIINSANELNKTVDGISTYSDNIKIIEDELKLIDLDTSYINAQKEIENTINWLKELERQAVEGDYDIQGTITYTAAFDGDGSTNTIKQNTSLTQSENVSRFKDMKLSDSGTYAVGHYDHQTNKRVIVGYTDDKDFAEYSSHQGGQGYYTEADRVHIVTKDNPKNTENFEWYKGSYKNSINTKETITDEEIQDGKSYVIEHDLINGMDAVVKEGNEKETYDFTKTLKSDDNLNYERISGYNLKKLLKSKDIYKAYAKGGLVDYTGPAWVDGTSSNPEAFLSAEDTRNIQALTEILQSILIPATTTATEKETIKSGDTNIEIHIEVEEMSDDYDVDQMLDQIQARISEASEGKVTIVR